MKRNLKSYKGDIYNTTPKQKQPPYDRFLRIAQVLDRVGFSRSTLYRKMNDDKNRFPRQLKISEQIAVWKESEVVAWMEAQKTGGES